jgi:hypothetical protein
MQIVIRANTFPTKPIGFLNDAGQPTMSFRKYWTTQWEWWMRLNYSDATKPFLLGPEVKYTKALDPHMLACTENFTQNVIKLSKSVGTLLDDATILGLYSRWRKMTVEEREDLLLANFQVAHEMFERASYPMLCVETPELTLSSLAGGDGTGILSFLFTAQSFGLIDFTKERIPVIKNEEWERLWCVGKYEKAFPLSSARRAFVDSAIAARAQHLLNFVQGWLYSLVRLFVCLLLTLLIVPALQQTGRPVVPALSAPVTALNEKTAPRMYSTDCKMDVQTRLDAARAASSIVRCDGCHKGDFISFLSLSHFKLTSFLSTDEASKPDSHFLCCSRCKAKGRKVWFCGLFVLFLVRLFSSH